MKLKLRTSSSIVILLAILGIVCLSLGMFFATFNVSFAEDGDEATEPETNPTTLADYDSDGNALWLVSYDGATAEPLKDGDGFKYLYPADSGDGVKVNTSLASEKNAYAFFKGDESKYYTVSLNPDYKVTSSETLADAYSLNTANYVNASDKGEEAMSLDVNTSVTIVNALDTDSTLTLTKKWTIATLINEITGNSIIDNGNYAFGSTFSNATLAIARHGNSVVYSINGARNITFTAVNNNGTFTYLDENGKDIDTSDVPSNSTYLREQLRTLRVGSYTLTITSTSEMDEGVYYASRVETCNFTVASVSLVDGDALANGFAYVLPEGASVVYSGAANNTPDITLTYNGVLLERDLDYTLTSENVNVCDNAKLTIVGVGSIEGSFQIEETFSISKAVNAWQEIPNIFRWQYGSFNKQINLIKGVPTLLDNAEDLYFSILTDNGDLYKGLEVIRLDSEGQIIDEQGAIVALLNDLQVGFYRLRATVVGNDNYSELSDEISFQVFKGVNSWDAGETPTIQTWIKGKYDPSVNVINAKAKFGETQIVIRNVETNEVVYATDIHGKVITDELASAKVGKYLLTASVAKTDNYDALTQTIEFEVFRNGLPVWAVVLIVVGSLGIVAIVFVILHEKGVLQMLTGKVIIAMRTRANVDATIAAVRANRIAREAEASIAAAKAREAEEEKAKNSKK